MNKISQPQSKGIILRVLAPLLLIEFAVAIAWGWMKGSYQGLHFGSWQIAEWLINYEGGFVRRGLAGQAIFYLGNGQDLLQLLYSVTVYFYIAYAAIFIAIYFFSKANNVKALLLAIVVPGGLFQMGMTIQFFTRKEILFLILFGLLCLQYLWIQRSQVQSGLQKGGRKLGWFYALAIVGGIAMTLIHEGYLFMSYPLTLLLGWVVKREYPDSWVAKWGCYLYAGIIPVVFAICALHHGDASVAQRVWESLSLDDRLKLAGAAPYTAFGPIASLGWGFQQNLLTIYGLWVTGGWKYWLFFILGNLLVLGWIANAMDPHRAELGSDSRTATRYLYLVLLGLLLSSSMFLIAADWGRWIAYITNSLLLFIFTLQQSSYAQEPIKIKEGSFTRVTIVIHKLLTSPSLFWITLVYAMTFKLPECCANPAFLLMPYGRIFGGL